DRPRPARRRRGRRLLQRLARPPGAHVIHDPSAHEPLTAESWDEERVRAGIASIVADAEGSLDDAGWPNHQHDDPEDLPERPTSVYFGSGGMVWALHALGSGLDLPGLAVETLRRYRGGPDL